jgi:hypothetical protein
VPTVLVTIEQPRNSGDSGRIRADPGG